MKSNHITIALLLFFSMSLSGQNVADNVMMAKAMIDRGKADEAIRIASEALNTAGDSRLLVIRAVAKEARGDYSGAIADYNEANRLTPGSGEFGLSRIYALKGDAQTSLYHLELNMASPFRKSEKEVMLDPSYGAIENKTEWRNFWKKERYTGLERKVSEVEYYTGSGKIEDSKSIIDELKRNYGGSEELIYSEALTELASGRPAEAIRLVSGLTSQYPGNEKYIRLLARAQEKSSNAAGASSSYSSLIDSGVADAELYLLRAECYRKTGENDKALADIQKYLQFYPDSRQAISLAGKTEAVSGDNLKAIEFFSRNLELHPNDADCYVDRGNSYLVSKSWDWAIKDYSMSLDLKPGNPDVWLNKGIALLNKGLSDDACFDFRKALSLGNKRASEYISRNCIK
jgi:tetratricopeptide (TPR) repeat protein